ncbi:hypothetical protein AB0G60_10600 [Streptomyces angustmyceticus]|uniref:DUF4034 domain-containing protein n=1 Tax=Streptomyces angustmyceticus TaxID=285578 RepID=A0A5J4LER5_9ACTN|nr:hypothetical protein [Streptomyces angustmyceticus]UAL70689.1 hypothetical protein K7396_32385 [Streptomyces angustmyceticus]GES30010.1 hypothetical protein San01_24970 [Streptomyces angustmyceticus]
MPAFRRRKGSLPRLVPELDDVTLGRVRRRVETCWSRGSLDTAVMALMADVINEAGQDWDRKAHRLGVLASAAGRSLPGIWRQHSPKDHGALLLHAWSDLIQARRQDSSVDLDATRETCRLAADLLPDDPTPWTLHLATLRVERRPSTELAAIWREIKARDPWNREAHLQALGYLSPQECGSSALVLDLLDGVRALMPPDAPAVGLELTSLVRSHQRAVADGGMTALGAGEIWRRPDAARALDQAAHYWPGPGFLRHAAALADLNLLAYALVKAGRTTEAGIALRATGGVATVWPWTMDGDPLERFTHFHGRYASGAADGGSAGRGTSWGR